MKKTKEVFDSRNEKKKLLEFQTKTRKNNVRVGEFWGYYEGVNIGSEISKNGKFLRPCLIIKTDFGNGLILVVPMTTKYKPRYNNWLLEIISYKKYGMKQSRLIINQMKLIDIKRLSDPLSKNMKNVALAKMVIDSIKSKI